MIFEWNDEKAAGNLIKHGVDFEVAKRAFLDPLRITTIDEGHSTETETRYFCFGQVDDRVMTVRFTLRNANIRILGAGYWRKGKRFYDEKNGIHG